MVDVNSQEKNAFVVGHKPWKTPYFDWQEKQSSMKSRQGRTAGPQTGTGAMKTNKEIVGPEYNFMITEHHRLGKDWWGFEIDDVNLEQGGIDIPEEILSAVSFLFFGGMGVTESESFPKCMDIVISSYWSILPNKPKIPKSTWNHKLFHFFKIKFRLAGNTTTSYSNFSQIVTLDANLSNCSTNVKVKSGPGDIK